MQCVALGTSFHVSILLAVAVFVLMAAVLLACLAHITPISCSLLFNLQHTVWKPSSRFNFFNNLRTPLISPLVMSGVPRVREAEEVAWSKLDGDQQLLGTALRLLHNERKELPYGSTRPSSIEQEVQTALEDTEQLLDAIADGHTLRESWRRPLLLRHIEQLQALGTIPVNTYAERIQQVRFRTNDLMNKCANLYIGPRL